MYATQQVSHSGLTSLCLAMISVLATVHAGYAAAPPSCNRDPVRADRVALVIGNSAYTDPVSGTKDAIDMACYLKQVGFTVIGPNLDGDHDSMEQWLTQFSDQIKEAKSVVFYFSGHGLQDDHGESYLLPVSTSFQRSMLISLTRVLRALNHALQRDAVKIVVLDACRTEVVLEPAGRELKPGLAKLEDETLGRNTIVAYATLYNQTAPSANPDENSPYTAVLLKYLREPGLEIRELFNRVSREVAQKQVSPWDEGGQNFDHSYYLREAVKIKARIVRADDNVLLLINHRAVLSGQSGQESHDPLDLQAGDNAIEVQVFNDRTYRNFHTWESAEGWKYELEFLDADGKRLSGAHWVEDGEDVVFKDGPHHGKWFTAARTGFYVDPGTAELRLGAPDQGIWKREGEPTYALDAALLCKMQVLPPLQLIGRSQAAYLLVGGPRSLAGKVNACFSGSVRAGIIEKAAAAAIRGGFGAAVDKVETPQACAADHLWYALEDHPPNDPELKNVPDCG